MRLLRDLWATSPARAGSVIALIVLGAGGQALASALAGPVLLHRSGPLFAALALALVCAVLGELGVGLLIAGLSADWSADVRRRLCGVALGQDLPALEATPVGELLDRIDGDVYQVASELRGSGIRVAQSAAVAVLSIVTASVLWWPAGLGMLLLGIVLMLALARRTRAISAARMGEEEAWSDLAAVTEESIHGQDDVRTSLAQPYVLGLYADRAHRVLERGRVVWAMSASVTALVSGVMRVGILAVVIGGAWQLSAGRIDGARLTSIWLLVIGYVMTIDHVGRMVPELQQALGAWGRVRLLSQARQEPAGGQSPRLGDLVIDGLTFGYAPTGPKVLRDVNLRFTPGRSYALLGRTGSGKSTLAKVLTRSVEVPRGTVFLAGTDLCDLDLEALRRWIAVVPQRTDVLAGTLAENVALFDPDLIEAGARALAELGLMPWVNDLPDGLATRLGEGGYVLSAGQEQLVAFARILVRDPQLVILDEATARLDPVTEAQVRRATARLLRGRIGVVIAHRLSSVRDLDEVVVLVDGEVVEAGALSESRRFAALLASSLSSSPSSSPSTSPAQAVPSQGGRGAPVRGSVGKVEPPPQPAPARARTLPEIFRMAMNDPQYGLRSLALFLVLIIAGLDGSVLPWLWARLVDGSGSPFWPAAGIAVGLLVSVPVPYYTGRWFPEWWVRQMLRIGLRLLYGQTGPRRGSSHTPAEVVAQLGDTERVVMLADNLIDQFVCLVIIVSMTVVSGTFVPALFFAGTMLVSGLAALLFGPRLARSAHRTVQARAAFSTALVSSLSAARTIKLAGASRSVLAHLAALDRLRSDRQRREIVVQVWARSTPSLTSGLLPIGVWLLYLSGGLSAGATLVTVSTLASARWFAWTTASLISQLPSARVWTHRTVAMAGVGGYTQPVPDVDLSAGTAPKPPVATRHPLRRLDLAGFSAIHDDGTVGARRIDLVIERGELVLLLGPVGSGKSSLLRALAGIVQHTGVLRWNGQPVTEPEHFLRPNQVGYVAQLPRVLSGTVGDNIRLGHQVDAAGAVSTAQLEHDLDRAGRGLGLLIGHKGTQLSGGQLQRLALARALAPRTELLVADDVSSALDVTTELQLWQALRGHGVTVVGSTSKRAALNQADRVLVLIGGEAVAQGKWQDLQDSWGHLAG